MLYARIDGAHVAEIVDVDGDPAEHFHESLIFMPAPEGCQPGWTLAGGVLEAPPIGREATSSMTIPEEPTRHSA